MKARTLFRWSLVAAVSGLILVTAFSNCSGFQSATTQSAQLSSPNPPPPPGGSLGKNSFPVVVTTFGSNGAPNVPMISATLCVPGTTNCTVVSNLLMDSGSEGLRVFATALPGSFVNSLPKTGFGECVFFAGNSVMWGPEANVTVEMGEETSGTVPMQIVQQSYGDNGTTCMNDTIQEEKQMGIYDASNPPFFDPGSDYNGILGVSFMVQDCGSFCVGSTNSNNGVYFTCSGSTCSGAAANLNQQVSNPIAFMPIDNNGLTVQLPSVSSMSTSAVVGTAFLGVGTQSNNMPGAAKVFTADTNASDNCYGNQQTTWAGSTNCAYMDTGSSCFFFPNQTTNAIAVDSSENYAPSSPMTLSATLIGMNGVSATESFVIASPDAATASTSVIPDSGSEEPAGQPFDWGLPFSSEKPSISEI